MKKSKSFFGYLLFLSFVVGLLVYLLQMNRNRSVVLSIEPEAPIVQATPIPTPISQVSPDGTYTVTLKTKGDLHEILVNDALISTRSMESGTSLSIPFNTWSPDDKYFFLKATNNDKNEYLVMTGSGKPFAGDVSYLMVTDQFAQAHPESQIVDVTGWAAPTLLIVNAKSENEAKMTFWFDVQTQKFIRLSNYFY